MKRTEYPPDFLELWDEFDVTFGSKGGIKKAYNVYKSLKVDADDLEMLLKAVIVQKDDKQQKRMRGQFYENFQHVERWLKNERWTDEICELSLAGNGQTLSRSDQRKAEAVARYRSKHMDDGVEPSGGNEFGVRGA